MANSVNTVVSDGKGTSYKSLDTTETDIPFGQANDRFGTTFTFQLLRSGSLGTGGLVMKWRLMGAPAQFEARACPVYGPDGDTAIAAGTPLDADGVYYVVADGMEISGDYTQDTASLEVAWRNGTF